MATYAVETYMSRVEGSDLDALASKLRNADESVFEGRAVRYLGSVYIPVDEICFHLIEGPSAAAVRRACGLAGLVAERVVQAVRSKEITPIG
jgi:hypothetical protein